MTRGPPGNSRLWAELRRKFLTY